MVQAPTLRLAAAVVTVALAMTAPSATSAAEPLPVSGPTDVVAIEDGVAIDLAYRANGRISLARVQLAGPAIERTLFETTDAASELTWSWVEPLPPGSYTVTVTVEVVRGLNRLAGSTSRTVIVGAVPKIAQPMPGGADGGPAPNTLALPDVQGDVDADVVVYGATPSGVMAAINASSPGLRVVLIEPTEHVGGMMTSGLNATDYGHTTMIGGRTRQFFDRVQAIEGSTYGRYRFQPSTAERVFVEMLNEAGVEVVTGERLAEAGGITMDGPRLTSLHAESGRTYRASVYVDASYEGDLMAAAGVPYQVGREPTTQYGEKRAGVLAGSVIFGVPAEVDAHVPLAAPGPRGSGDERIQNSNYRLCFSTDSTNQVAFEAPAGYDRATYDLAAAYIDWRVARGETPDMTWFLWPVALTNGKYDVNNNGPVSIGVMGANTAYPEGTYAERDDIEESLHSYTAGFLYFLREDNRVPERIRAQMAAFGLCADEFADSGNWPRLLYLREGRRMVGAHVLTERDIELTRTKADTVAVGSYAFDSHHVSRWIDGSRRLVVEGGFWDGRAKATRWSIPFRVLTPKAEHATNLLVSVTASASHVAFAAYRLEPQYMMAGEAAGMASAMVAAAAVAGTPISVQSVDVDDLRRRLREIGAIVDNYVFWDILDSPFRSAIEHSHMRGVTFGCSPIYFCPTSTLRRDEMAAFLTRALRLPATTGDYFTDDEGNAHEDSINRLAAAGITAGCGPGRYCPSGSVTRGQMAAFLVRSFRPPAATQDYFDDDETSIFEGDINRLAATGITGGCGVRRFCPTAIVSREQIAAFLWRAIR